MMRYFIKKDGFKFLDEVCHFVDFKQNIINLISERENEVWEH